MFLSIHFIFFVSFPKKPSTHFPPLKVLDSKRAVQKKKQPNILGTEKRDWCPGREVGGVMGDRVGRCDLAVGKAQGRGGQTSDQLL